jgi:hypothetical protein
MTAILTNNSRYYSRYMVSCGADGATRTHDQRFRRPLLYPLSYARMPHSIIA